MGKVILGVDPGKEGGITILSADSIILEIMPADDDGINVLEFDRLIRHYKDEITKCYLELASLRPMQSGQFEIGRGFGRIEAALAYLCIPVCTVRPGDWSKFYPHGVEERDIAKRKPMIKKARAEIVKKLFPGINFLATTRSKVLHDGLVDSALIAHYGMNYAK